MNPSPSRPQGDARAPEARPLTSSPSEDAFHVPPIAEDEDGPDVTTQPGAEVGHYGMGYGDPTRHQGGSWPGEGANLPPQQHQAVPPGTQTNAPSAPGATQPGADRDKGGGQQ